MLTHIISEKGFFCIHTEAIYIIDDYLFFAHLKDYLIQFNGQAQFLSVSQCNYIVKKV